MSQEERKDGLDDATSGDLPDDDLPVVSLPNANGNGAPLAHANSANGDLAQGQPANGEVTGDDSLVRRLLERVEAGDQDARGEIVALLYDDLRRRAHTLLRGARRGQTLQTTALANEACLRLLNNHARWADRQHFLSVAAKAMRSVLVDRARWQRRLKRSPHGERVPLDELLHAYTERGIDVPRLDEAIERLAQFDPEMARAVELRFFAALDVAETARTLGMSQRTFNRRWAVTRAWLRAALED
jgi:RNA polymerase sigma-70 factor (ECF subfamily)